MRISPRFLTAVMAAGALAPVVACQPIAIGPTAVEPNFDAEDPPPTLKKVTVCKVGTDAEFRVTIGSGTPDTLSLAEGSCAVVAEWVDVTSPLDVTVTELELAGTQLDSIAKDSVYTVLTNPPTYETATWITGTNTVVGHQGGGKGAVLTFFNSLVGQADTSRPAVPNGFDSPDSAVALLVNPPGSDPELLVFRNFVHIEFDDTTTGTTVRDLFARYGATVAGGYPLTGAYIIQVPDPGPAYADLKALLAQLAAEPGVAWVYRRVKFEPEGSLGRFPEDGSLSRREDWLGAPTDATRGLRAIRAPLAWGCETGTYGSSPVGIGVIDDVFGTGIADLSSVVEHSVDPTVAAFRALTDPARLSHGTGVSGVIGARGDNGSGVAGLVWASTLHQFRLAREVGLVTRMVEDPGAYIAHVVLPAAIQAPIRILHSSIEAPIDARVANIIELNLRQFVDASPGGRLFVQAGQNTRGTILPDTADQIQGGFLMEQAVANLGGTPDANRVILVGAANRDGTTLWGAGTPGGDGATLWSGVTAILAPSESILVLARPQDFAAGTFATSGTSFGAPMVSGVAAQLWTFDPTLTADEVRDYILRGAQEPKSFGPTGAPVPPTPIAGSGGLFLLDAYGALTLASRERPNTTPICGVKVWAQGANVAVARDVVQLWSVPGATGPLSVSVAQGGRLIAASDGAQVFTLDHQGNPVETLSLRRRVYLERDTMDLVTGPAGVLVSITGPNGVPAFDPVERVLPSLPPELHSAWNVGAVEASPVGDWLAVRLHESNALLCESAYWYLVPASGQPAVLVQAMLGNPPAAGFPLEACHANKMSAGWSHDGQRTAITILRGLSGEKETGLRMISIVNGQPVGVTSEIVLGGLWLFQPRFTANDSLLMVNEQTEEDACSLAYRVAGAPGSRVRTEFALPSDCDAPITPPTIFNTRVAPPASPAQRRR
ncbi:MAG TPA: S8 family serine peptidase [Gemmatimonadales bacterium]